MEYTSVYDVTESRRLGVDGTQRRKHPAGTGAGHCAERFHLAWSGQYLADHVAFHIGQPVLAAAIAIGELFVIEPELMEHRRVEVVDVDLALDGFITELIGRAED